MNNPQDNIGKRAIKFRVWDNLINEMLIDPIDSCSLNLHKDYIMYLARDSGVVPMQYTGLKDKNGKEIYEGDIVITSSYPWLIPVDDNLNLNEVLDLSTVKTVPNYRGLVEWYYSAWQVSAFSVNPNNAGRASGEGLNDEGIDEGQNSKWEIIGNVFENPELLSQNES